MSQTMSVGRYIGFILLGIKVQASVLSAAEAESDVAFLVQKSVSYAEEMHNLFPSEDFFILHFGPTAALSSAHFRETGIRGPRGQDWDELMLRGINQMDQSDSRARELVFQVLDQVIPSPNQLKGRTIIIHRTLWNGQTMNSFASLLADYVADRGREIDFGYFLVGDESQTYPVNGGVFEEAHSRFVDDPQYFEQMLSFVRRTPENRRPAVPLLALASTEEIQVTDLNSGMNWRPKSTRESVLGLKDFQDSFSRNSSVCSGIFKKLKN